MSTRRRFASPKFLSRLLLADGMVTGVTALLLIMTASAWVTFGPGWQPTTLGIALVCALAMVVFAGQDWMDLCGTRHYADRAGMTALAAAAWAPPHGVRLESPLAIMAAGGIDIRESPRSRRILRRLSAVTLAVCGVTLPGWALGQVNGDSMHRRVVLENEHVRVAELFVSPGAQSPMHVQAPGVLVSLSKARFEMTAPDGTTSIVDHNPGQVLWVGEPQHRAWRLMAGEAHVFFVEVKSLAAGAVPADVPLEPTHSTVIDPDQHHLVFENEHVRVIDGMAGAGAISAAHTHPPSVLVSLAKSRFRVTINGKTRIFDFEPAMVRWTNHFEHTWEILAGDARVIMIELKSAHGDPAFRRRF